MIRVRIITILIACIFCYMMTACSKLSSQQPPAVDSTEGRKINAAKINVRLGMAYLERKDLKRSKQKFLMAMEEAPELPEVWYSMAYFLENTGGNQQANAYYLKAISLAPKRGDTLNNYGTYLCRTGKYKTAIQYFVQAAHDQDYLDPSAALENAGLCALKIPNKPMAMYYFKKAVEHDSGRATSLEELAKLNYQTGNYQVAAQRLRQFEAVWLPRQPPSNWRRNLKSSAKTDAKLYNDEVCFVFDHCE